MGKQRVALIVVAQLSRDFLLRRRVRSDTSFADLRRAFNRAFRRAGEVHGTE